MQDRVELPSWLSGQSAKDLQRYTDLEQANERAEIELGRELAIVASLRSYANYQVKRWVASTFGKVVDPDQIMTTTHYEFNVGGRTLVQEDKRTLTELALFGVHDSNNSFTVLYEGSQIPSGVNFRGLDAWLGSVNLRSTFWAALFERFKDPKVRMALMESLGTRIALTVFSAKLQGHINDSDLAMVERSNLGDPAYAPQAYYLPNCDSSLKDVMVFARKNDPRSDFVLYAPDSPGGQDWYSFPSERALEFALLGWSETDEGLEYLVQQNMPGDRATARKYLRHLQQLPSAMEKGYFNAWDNTSEGVLGQLISYRIDWDLAQQSTVDPRNFRRGPAIYRQYFARFDTELKALYTVETRDAGFLSYEKFTYELTKKTIENILNQRGERVEVDPDLVVIEFDAEDHESMTSVITRERPFYANEPSRGAAETYPRFSLAEGHPAVKTLNIFELASVSRSLRAGEKYIDMLRSVVLNEQEQGYHFRRSVYHQRQLVEMQRANLSEYFHGRISEEQMHCCKELIISLSTRDLRLTHPLGDAPVEDNSVYQFHLGHRRPVLGVYVFRCKIDAVVEDWLYTPQSPDGIWFRRLKEFDASVRTHGLGSYYLERVAYTDQKAVIKYFSELEASSEKLPSPKLQISSRVRDFPAAYRQMVLRIIDDVDAQTTSLGEIIAQLVYDNVILAAQVISMVIPPVGLVVSAVTITKNILDGAQAYHNGDDRLAFGHFRDALIALVTLGYGQYKKLGIQAITNTQKTLIGLAGDAKTVASLYSSATGQKVPHQLLLEIVQDVLAQGDTGKSTTTVH
ncbi:MULTISPECIES: dermonecrotic toxin domain-containing protein [unclassified Pseudomonas]|uniref:dermonecrotic toxin domain-containing protein n=1 Tax=unclassified Pseudomonas TaxID=196821 RepID=UPI002AC94374|nr:MULTISPECIES: DUF6543 domain-containing protein [unclassified Pseudomonas]MEB0044306.1 hypothetical protein [Pseudomonas sp. Dout3]MEB0094757.1 hypothetical protein [Pseudomonas sp. DC1.2]WPX59877.1 hypothetical protein RHM68_04330 [Pseudomonas sp. DC1.2]